MAGEKLTKNPRRLAARRALEDSRPQPLAPQPSQRNEPVRPRQLHQRPGQRLDQLRGLLPLRVVFPWLCASTSISFDGRCSRPLAHAPTHQQPTCGRRMTGDCHVRSCERGRVRLPPATHQKGGRWPNGQPDETHEKPKGQRAVPDGTPNNQRPTSPPEQIHTTRSTPAQPPKHPAPHTAYTPNIQTTAPLTPPNTATPEDSPRSAQTLSQRSYHYSLSAIYL